MKIFVGYDTREDITYQVCEHSIKQHQPNAEVLPLKMKELREAGLYTRPIDPLSTTEFTFSRFLIPYMTNYTGWAVFCDCDFVWTADVAELFAQADERYAVMVVKHDYTPAPGVKMDNQKQMPYPRKNWSSMILWNCAHPANRAVTPELVNKETGQYLHRFSWLKDEEIGSVDHSWNWLVGWYKAPKDGEPKVLHYTEGGPWFKEYRDCEYNDVWKKYLANMLKIN
jgi:lipopolysaccharide biosynthesis glycosyltransferase